MTYNEETHRALPQTPASSRISPTARWLRLGYSIFPMERVTEIRALSEGVVEVYVHSDLPGGSREPADVNECEMTWHLVEEHDTLLSALMAASRYADEYEESMAELNREARQNAK